MDSYPKAAMERAMKVQDVMLQAMAKKITWWQAAEILGISDRHMRRWRERYEEEGYNGLLDRRRGKPSRRRVPLATVEKVFALYREKYFDLSVQHFHEKLEAEHGIELSYTWVKQALQGAGLVARGRKRGVHRKRRERRPLPGMLLHIDGSRHQWFQDERWYDLMVILDDATSEIYYAQLVEEESTETVMAGLKEVVERKGVFCALYSDRGSHFWLTPKVGGKVDYHRRTQVGRALHELGVQMIPAYSPQARGRSERNFGTWQGRLPQELRLAACTTLKQANGFLRERYIAEFNRRFQVAPRQRGNAFVPCRSRDLDRIFSLQFERGVNRDNTVSFQNLSLQIERVNWRATLAGCQVVVHQHLDGTLSITHGPHGLGRYTSQGATLETTKMPARRAVEKPLGGKVKKPTFPPSLEIPQSPRDSHFPTAPTAAG
ncbi:MAG TPA: ISNCY family transposase [Candidatus Sulfotelmatobacter sp.]|jgi:transposase|nr:ISNCY family transposase [Candidatus Sulfotelmatobacter sp.]